MEFQNAFKKKLTSLVLSFLTFRDRSEKEIKDYLFKKLQKEETNKDYSAAIVEEIIEDLKNLKLIDDQKFAKNWVESQLRKGKSFSIIKQQLFIKGLGRELVENILESLDSKIEEDLVFKIASKKLSSLKNLTIQEKRKKLSEFLLRRGFDWDLIKSVIDNLKPLKEI